MSDNTLYIRADMNDEIATGHVMRCLSIADSAKVRGIKTVFISADDQPKSLVESRGYESVILGTAWDDMESEITELTKVINKKNISSLLIDSYKVTEEYLRKVNALTRVYYLDDLNAFPYPVHAVINYANYADENFYPVRFPGTMFYLGSAYAPLRGAFKNTLPKKIRYDIHNLLVMSGGADPFGILEQILDAIPLDEFRQVNVICGKYNKKGNYLKEKYMFHPSVRVHSGVDKIWEFYDITDLAVSAGGSTLYELASMGVPTITYSMADNQIRNVRSLDLDGLMPCAGDVRGGNVPARVAQLIKELAPVDIRTDYSRKLRRTIDGKGADRLVNILFS